MFTQYLVQLKRAHLTAAYDKTEVASATEAQVIENTGRTLAYMVIEGELLAMSIVSSGRRMLVWSTLNLVMRITQLLEAGRFRCRNGRERTMVRQTRDAI